MKKEYFKILPVPNLEVLGYNNDASQRIVLRMHDESSHSHNSSWFHSNIQRPAEFVSSDVLF